MSELNNEMIEKIAKAVAREVSSGSCRCALDKELLKKHQEHHLFIDELIGFLKTMKRSVLTTVITTIVTGILFLIWVGFRSIK